MNTGNIRNNHENRQVAFVYCRVSTIERALKGYSLRTQKEYGCVDLTPQDIHYFTSLPSDIIPPVVTLTGIENRLKQLTFDDVRDLNNEK